MVYLNLGYHKTTKKLHSSVQRFIAVSVSILQWLSACEALCPAGFRPPDCIHQCPRGHYGLGCASMCPITCHTPTCRPDSGHCFRCREGFRGPMCNKKCAEGSYGQDCIHMCGKHCLGFLCDPFTGACPGCEPGFFGTRCDQVGQVNQEKNVLSKLLTQLWEQTNDTESLASIAALRARLEREKQRRPLVGEEERRAFYTASIFICSIVPICLLGTCLYLVKEKIKSSFSGLLGKKRWIRARDGFFAKSVLPTSKSRLIQSQSNDNSYKLPLVNFRLEEEDNTRNNFEIRTQPKGYVDQRVGSTKAKTPVESKKSSDETSPHVESSQSNPKLSSSGSQNNIADANHQPKAVQGDDSAWTADIDTTVPVGHHDKKQDGYITRPRAFWRRLLHSIFSRKSHQPKDKPTTNQPTAASRNDEERATADDLQVPTAIIQQPRNILEATSHSSSSESGTDSPSTVAPAEDKVLQECVAEELKNMSPTKKKRWNSPLSLQKLFLAFHSSKDSECGDGGPRAAVAGDGKFPTKLQEGKVTTAAISAKPKLNQEDRAKLFERLKRNVIEELRLLEAVEEANALPARSASDQVLAKSSQIRENGSLAGQKSHHGKQRMSFFQRFHRPQIFGFKNKHLEFEEAKSVASMGKFTSLKFRAYKMLDRFSHPKTRGSLSPYFNKRLPGSVTFNETHQMELGEIHRDTLGKQMKRCSVSNGNKMLMKNLSPGKARAYSVEESHINSLDLESKRDIKSILDRMAQGNLLGHGSLQKLSAFGSRQSVHELSNQQSPSGSRRQNIQTLSPRHQSNFEKEEGIPYQIYRQQRQDTSDVLLVESKKTTTMVNSGTSPWHWKCVSHQTSPIRSFENSPLPSHKARTENSVPGIDPKARNQAYTKGKSSSPSRFCDRSQSPGDAFCDDHLNSIGPKLSNGTHPASKSSSVDLETTSNEDEELSKISEAINIKELSRPITRPEQNERDKPLVKSGNTSNHPQGRTERISPQKIRLEEDKVTKKVSWEKSCTKKSSIHNKPVSLSGVKKSVDANTRVTNSPEAESEKRLDAISIENNSKTARETQITPISETPYLSAKVLRAKYVPPQLMSSNSASIPPNLRGMSGVSNLSHSVQAVHRNQLNKDLQPSMRHAPIYVPIENMTQKFGLVSMQPRLNEPRREQMTLNKLDKFHCPRLPHKEGTRTGAAQIVGDNRDIYGNSYHIQSRAYPHSGLSALPVHPGPAPKQTLQAPGSDNQLQETMSFSDSLIKTPRSSDGDCVIVHAFRDREPVNLEDRGAHPLFSSESSTPIWSSTPSEREMEDCLNSPIPCHLDRKEKEVCQSTSETLTVQRATPTSGNTYPERQSFFPRETMNIVCDGTEEEFCQPSSEALTVQRGVSAEGKKYLESQSYFYRRALNSVRDRTEQVCQSSSEALSEQRVVSRDSKGYQERQSFLPRESTNTEVIEVSDTMKNLSYPELSPSGQAETTTKFSSLDESHECITPNKRQLPSYIIKDARQKLWPPKHGAQIQQRDSTKRENSNAIFKECEERLNVHCEQETLPVPTLLEHSLQSVESYLSDKDVKKTPVSEKSSALTKPTTNSVQLTSAYGLTLRDMDEFRSIQEPSSERYYDALEPDPLLWARLRSGRRGTHLSQTKHRGDGTTTSRTATKVSSTRRHKVKSKRSEHQKPSSNAVFRFASKDIEEKQKVQYQDTKNPDSKIVLRFANFPLDHITESSDKGYKRSRSLRRLSVDEKSNSHVHDKRRNKSVEPDYKSRQRNSEENNPSSGGIRQKREKAETNPEKTLHGEQPLASFSHKRENPEVGANSTEQSDKSQNQNASKPSVNSDKSYRPISKGDSKKPEKGHEKEAKACPESCINNEDTTANKTGNSQTNSNALVCPHSVIIKSAQKSKPVNKTARFLARAPPNIPPSIIHQSIQRPAVHSDLATDCIYRTSAVNTKSPHEPQSTPQIYYQRLPTDNVNIGKGHLGQAPIYNSSDPNLSRNYRLNNSTFQNRGQSNSATYAVATPQAVPNVHNQSINQGHLQSNNVSYTNTTPQTVSSVHDQSIRQVYLQSNNVSSSNATTQGQLNVHQHNIKQGYVQPNNVSYSNTTSQAVSNVHDQCIKQGYVPSNNVSFSNATTQGQLNVHQHNIKQSYLQPNNVSYSNATSQAVSNLHNQCIIRGQAQPKNVSYPSARQQNVSHAHNQGIIQGHVLSNNLSLSNATIQGQLNVHPHQNIREGYGQLKNVSHSNTMPQAPPNACLPIRRQGPSPVASAVHCVHSGHPIASSYSEQNTTPDCQQGNFAPIQLHPRLSASEQMRPISQLPNGAVSLQPLLYLPPKQYE